jgi:hypothetical protein
MNRKPISVELLINNEGQIEGLPPNPRFITDRQYKLLLKSVQDDPEFMEARELLAVEYKDKYLVIAGNMRLRACKELGWKTIPTKIYPADTPTKKLRAYAIKDNKSYGEMDWDIIADQWNENELIEWGIDKVNYNTPFTPNFDPKIGDNEQYDKINDDLIEQRAREIAESIVKEKKLLEITCPNCGEEFSIE